MNSRLLQSKTESENEEKEQVLKYKIFETIYGYKKRLEFIRGNINLDDRLLDFGCGTGVWISIPLAIEGYNIKGIDICRESIHYGKKLIEKSHLGINPDVLEHIDLADNRGSYDVIIASEVLEHIYNVDDILKLIYIKLRIGGRLIITVPNGYGWFEKESFLWNKLKIGSFLKFTKIYHILLFLRQKLYKKYLNKYSSSLSNSPHIQRFTLDSICTLIRQHGFQIIDVTGSTLIAGPLSNTLFTGNQWIMGLNNKLGSKFSSYASGFYIIAKKINSYAEARCLIG